MIQLFTIIAVAVLVAADQVIKLLVESNMSLYETVQAIPDILGFTYVRNTGAAFGFLEGNRVLLIVITGVILAACLVYLLVKKKNSKLEHIAFLMIVAGGIGNFVDRIIRGYVVDYLHILCINFSIFNFADCLVTVGAGLLILSMIIEIVKDSKGKKQKNAITDGEQEK